MEQMDHGTSMVISGEVFFSINLFQVHFLSKKSACFSQIPKKTNNEKGHIYHGEISLSRVFFYGEVMVR